MLPVDGVDANLSDLRSTLATVRRLVATLGDLQEVAEVDRITFTARMARLGDLEVETLLGLAAQGHSIEITTSAGGWSLKVRAEGPAHPTVEMSGPPEEGLPGSAVDDMQRALARGDAAAALDLARDVPGAASVVLRNDASQSGVHWVLSPQDLQRLLRGPTWPATARRLAAGPRVVVLDGMGRACLMTRGAVFLGPEAQCEPPIASEADLAYRQARITEGRMELPSPLVFEPVSQVADTDMEQSDGDLGDLQRCLGGTARNLVWYWLAGDAKIRDDGVIGATFSGARVVSVELRPEDTDSIAPEAALYEWAASGTNPARREALQQAVSLALVTSDDLPTAARPALRTARLLFDLSQRGAVAEALAARRTARVAAAESARGTAQAAREAAGKAVERALIHAAAAVGIILSNTSDLIGRAPAFVLLVLVAAVAAASLLVAILVELPSAQDGLTSELTDLRQYRDSLSNEEVGEIANSDAVKSARKDLVRTRRTIVAVYVTVITAVLFLGGPYLLAHGGEPQIKVPSPQPSPTVSVSSP